MSAYIALSKPAWTVGLAMLCFLLFLGTFSMCVCVLFFFCFFLLRLCV